MQDTFKVCLLCRNPFGRNSVAHELEIKRLGQSFDGTDTFCLISYTPAVGSLCLTSWVDPGGRIEPDGSHYHWRMRWPLALRPGDDALDAGWPGARPAGRWFTIPRNGWDEADLLTEGAHQIFLPLVTHGYF